MRRSRGAGLVLACLLAIGGMRNGWGQEDFTFVTFHLVRAGLPVPEYTFVIYQDGGSTYTAENAAVPGRSGAATAETNKTVQRMAGASALAAKIVAQARSVQDLQNCASKRKGIANSGDKTLTLHVAYKETTTCTFNYSENTVVQELTRRFQTMAFTLDMGRRMERDERFDRLALDADMTALVAAVKGGQAMGMEWIRGTLEGLVKDPAVLERVRNQAAKLLEQIAAGQ